MTKEELDRMLAEEFIAAPVPRNLEAINARNLEAINEVLYDFEKLVDGNR